MILIEKKLGNIREPKWNGAVVDYLSLEQWEAPRTRLRKHTAGGIELAISLPRSVHLHDGDVLHHDSGENRIVVAKIRMKEVMVIDLQDIDAMTVSEIVRLAFEMGHALGNQHWPAVIKKTTIYIPLSVDRRVMSSVMKTHAFEHADIRFEPGEKVAAGLDAKEIRLLFAGADATPHHHHDHGEIR